MSKIIAVGNLKGGVGKTTSTHNLAAAFSAQGERVLIVDLDPQANICTSVGIDAESLEYTVRDVLVDCDETPAEKPILQLKGEGIDLLPSNEGLRGLEKDLIDLDQFQWWQRLKLALEPLDEVYDVILIDTPPSGACLTRVGLCAADVVVVPIECQLVPYKSVRYMIRLIEQVQEGPNPELIWRSIVTKYDQRTGQSKDILKQCKAYLGDAFINHPVPSRQDVSNANIKGLSVVTHKPKSDVSKAYLAIAKELAKL